MIYKEKILLFVCAFCISLSIASSFDLAYAVSDSDYSGISYDNFLIQITQGNSLIFQPLKSDLGAYVAVNVYNGTWNATNCYLWFGDQIGGKLTFLAETNAVFFISFDSGTISKVVFNNNGVPSTGAYFPVVAGRTYDLYWNSVLPPALPIMLIIGIIGIIMLIVGPMMLIQKLRNRDMDGLTTAIIIAAIGFGLTVAWLWS